MSSLHKSTTKYFIAASVLVLGMASAAQAAVSPQEAEKLKTTLTPLGGEKAGNADGTIPAWTGGMNTPGELKTIDEFPDPFAGEKPQFSITAANLAQYQDKLTEGTKALLQKFPDTYRVDVYKTQRSAAARQFIYDNAFLNATRAKLVDHAPVGAWGGTPFPIPNDGEEVMWNHVLRWSTPSMAHHGVNWLITSAGEKVMISDLRYSYAFPFLDETVGKGKNDPAYELIRFETLGPPIRAGEGVLSYNSYNTNDDASWVYLTGQRRVRKIPVACCDTPHPATAGLLGYDEVFVFHGRTNRYDWNIVGKKEIYVPYNTNMTATAPNSDVVLGTHHLNPDWLRWELHRVWVVEATLKPGMRHTTPKAKFYVDEDSWFAVLGERYDANNQLWKVGFNPPAIMPQIPAVMQTTFGYVDLQSGTQFYSSVFNDVKKSKITWPKGYAEDFFTPEALAGEGVR